MSDVPGGFPHYIGIFEGLKLGRALQISVPEELVIVAVEGGDCRTVGGSMSQSVQDSIPVVLQQVSEIIHSFTEQARKEEH